MENNEQKNQASKTPKSAPSPVKTGAPKVAPGMARPTTSAKTGTNLKPTNLTTGAKNSNGINPTASKNAPKSISNLGKSSSEMIKPKVQEIDSNVVAHKEDNTEKKKKSKKIVLILLLLLLIAGGVGTAVFFITKVPKTDMKFSIVTKTEFNNTEIDSGGDERELIYVPGDVVDASLEIKIQNDKGTITSSEKVYLRFRIDIIIDGNNYYGGLFDPEFEYAEDWVYNSADNYYYYNYYCYGKEKFTPFDRLDFVGDRYNNMLNGKTGQIVFTVEILEGNTNAVSDLWNTAPKNWKPVKK